MALSYTLDGVRHEGFCRLRDVAQIKPDYLIALFEEEGEWELWLVEGKVGADVFLAHLQEEWAQNHDDNDLMLFPPVLFMKPDPAALAAAKQITARQQREQARRAQMWRELTDEQKELVLEQESFTERRSMMEQFAHQNAQ